MKEKSKAIGAPRRITKQSVASVQERIHALMPTSEIVLPAWYGCLNFAAQDADIVAQFSKETGHVPPRNGLEAAIDEATGHAGDAAIAFVWYVNRWIWGERLSDGRACNGDEPQEALWSPEKEAAK